jgi:hypothetical protein
MGGNGSRGPGKHVRPSPDDGPGRMWWAAVVTLAASLVSLLAALLAFCH